MTTASPLAGIFLLIIIYFVLFLKVKEVKRRWSMLQMH